jgi:hypothetical protein
MLGISKDYIDRIRNEEWASSVRSDDLFWEGMSEWILKRLLPDAAKALSGLVDSIVDIDPGHSERKILERVAQILVESLDAALASARIYSPDTGNMLTYGSYPPEDDSRKIHIALEGSVAGRVILSQKPCLVPNIMEEALYSDKSIVERKGVNSLMAIPFEIPRFFPHERNTTGVIQIYFASNNREFTSMELQLAILLAKRLGFVIAQKKILLMQRMNEKKEKILKLLFTKMGTLEGVKMKDIFNRLIPELADMINIKSCALFSVHEDLKQVLLDA